MLFAKPHSKRLPLLIAFFIVGCAMLHARASVNHYLTASVAGGTALNMVCQYPVKTAAGADAQVAFAYEVAKKGFFFNIGLGMDYVMLREKVETFSDSYDRFDKDGRPIRYSYVFNNYSDQQHILMASVPFQFGYRFHRLAYLAAGLKISIPVMAQYATSTNLYTEGEYRNLIQPISRNVPSYGYYPEMQYTDKGKFTYSDIHITPTFEIGGVVPLAPGMQCRIGFFAEYSLPVSGTLATSDLVDYSAVDFNPATQNSDNLQNNIHFAPMLYAHFPIGVADWAGNKLMKSVAQHVDFGIRVTFRFNVSSHPTVCNCNND